MVGFNAAWFWLLEGVLAYRFVWVGLLGLLLVLGLGALFWIWMPRVWFGLLVGFACDFVG